MSLTLSFPDGSTLHPKLWHRHERGRASRNIVHELADGRTVVTRRRPSAVRAVLRLLFDSEVAALVADILHRDAATPIRLTDPDVPSVSMSYVLDESGRTTVRQEPDYPDVWWYEADVIDVSTPLALDVVAPWTEIARNYAPPITGSGQWAEVRRNHFPDPMLTSIVVGAGGPYHQILRAQINVTDGLAVTRTATPASGVARVQSHLDMSSVPVGAPVLFSALRRLAAPISTGRDAGQLVVEWVDSSLATSYGTGASFNDLTTTGEQLHEVVTTRPDAAASVLVVRFNTGGAVGDLVRWYDPMVEVGVTARQPWFAPAMPGDPDMRARHTGAAGNSPLVLEIETAAGYTGTSCIAGYSTRDGLPALRLIPTSDTNSNSFAAYTIPAPLRAGGVLAAVRHLDAPLTGPINWTGIGLGAVTPDSYSDADNAAGSVPLTVAYGPLSGTYQARFYHGGRAGSGEVSYALPGLYPAGYEGGYFDAGTPSDAVNRYRVVAGAVVHEARRIAGGTPA